MAVILSGGDELNQVTVFARHNSYMSKFVTIG